MEDNNLIAKAGGHVQLRTLYNKFVCKSFNQREQDFYQNIPPDLRLVVPRYGGTLNSENGKFLVMENLTKDFLKPSVMDLKMGTRMYSDFASESKMLSQKRKSSRTTSSSLGVRFCGSVKYEARNNDFKRTDKYTGRTADLFTLTSLLQDFFSISGTGKILHYIIKCVIKELNRIKEILEHLDGFRLYSSSVLIIYDTIVDTDTEDDNPHELLCPLTSVPKVRVKIIDFANSALPGDQVPHPGPDTGFLLGVQSLIKMLELLIHL